MQRSPLDRKIKECAICIGPLHHKQALARIARLSGIASMNATAVLANVIDQAITFVRVRQPVAEDAFMFLRYVDQLAHSNNSPKSSSMLSLTGRLMAVISAPGKPSFT